MVWWRLWLRNMFKVTELHVCLGKTRHRFCVKFMTVTYLKSLYYKFLFWYSLLADIKQGIIKLTLWNFQYFIPTLSLKHGIKLMAKLDWMCFQEYGFALSISIVLDKRSESCDSLILVFKFMFILLFVLCLCMKSTRVHLICYLYMGSYEQDTFINHSLHGQFRNINIYFRETVIPNLILVSIPPPFFF